MAGVRLFAGMYAHVDLVAVVHTELFVALGAFEADGVTIPP